MLKRPLLSFLGIWLSVLIPLSVYAQAEQDNSDSSYPGADIPYERTFDFVLRFGMGGFSDSRSPEHKLGGGQLALDIRPRDLPVAISLSSEFYTNSAEPTYPYEISNLLSLNVLYMASLSACEKLNYFLGGGIGRIEVPKSVTEPGVRVEDNAFNLEAGIDYRYFEKLGFYAAVKYLTADKKLNNVKVIDFRESILLLGITYHFSL